MNRFPVLLLFLLYTSAVTAASLPEHPPISILIVADEVNPHQLPDELLTQPEDLAPALSRSTSGLAIASINTVDSQCVDDALVSLGSDNPPDVLLYFAHRGATDCEGSNAQPEFTKGVEKGLQEGMGLVVLHHGLYVDFRNRGVKAPLLALIGSEADSIEWNTESGQRVYNIQPGHFITRNGLEYSSSGAFQGSEEVDAGTFPLFTNRPDELYELIRVHHEPGEHRTPLFATDSGSPRTLGYVLERQGWTGRVVTWQPGEYQPNALDDHTGPNFQILVNAIYFSAFGANDH